MKAFCRAVILCGLMGSLTQGKIVPNLRDVSQVLPSEWVELSPAVDFTSGGRQRTSLRQNEPDAVAVPSSTGYFYYQYYSDGACTTSTNSYGFALNQCYNGYNALGAPVGSVYFTCGFGATVTLFSGLNCQGSIAYTSSNTINSCTATSSGSIQGLCTSSSINTNKQSILVRFVYMCSY